MHFNDNLRLLLIGAGVLEKHADGTYYGKTSVVEHVHQLKLFFDKVAWMTWLEPGSKLFLTKVDDSKVDVIPIKKKGILEIIKIFSFFINNEFSHVKLHLPDTLMSFVVAVFRWKIKHLTVYIAGDWEVLCKIRLGNNSYLWRKKYELFHVIPMRLADLVITRGKKIKNNAMRYNKNVVETVPIISNELRKGKNKPEINKESHHIRILYVGKIIESKGVGVLLDAFSNLIKMNLKKNFKLIYVGDGEFTNNLKKIVVERHLEDKVSFLGWVDDQKKLATIYSSSDILVMPSIYPEGVPRVIDEAILHNLAIIATDVGGIRDEYSNGEIYIIKSNDTAALVSAIVKAINDDESNQIAFKARGKMIDLLTINVSAAEQHAKLMLGLF